MEGARASMRGERKFNRGRNSAPRGDSVGVTAVSCDRDRDCSAVAHFRPDHASKRQARFVT